MTARFLITVIAVTIVFSVLTTLSFPRMSGVLAVTQTDLANLRGSDSTFARAYDRVFLEDAWEAMRAASSLTDPKFGVVDTGIDPSHAEFANVNTKSVFRSGALRDQTVAACDRDIAGGPIFVSGHGTAVAGIMAANNISDDPGGAYVFPQMNGVLSGVLQEDAYSLEVGFTSPLTNFDTRFFARRIIEDGAKIVNFSFGLPGQEGASHRDCAVSPLAFFVHTRAWVDFFQRAQQEFPDRLFIVAAGNSGVSVEFETPANVVLEDPSLGNVIVVSATDLEDQRASFSNFGSGIHLAAPGTDVYVPRPGNEYDSNFSGTSAAAPFVTGVAGLIKAVKPELSPAEIKQILIETADPIQTGEPDKRLGTGCYANPNDPVNTGCRLNAHSAVCHPLVLNCQPSTIIAGSDEQIELVTYPAIGYGDGVYLVVYPRYYRERQVPDRYTVDLVGVRIAENGTILDEEPFIIVPPRPQEIYLPRIAFRNGTFLVVWTRSGSYPPFEGEELWNGIAGSRIRSDGTVLDLGGREIARGQDPPFPCSFQPSTPELAATPEGFVLVFHAIWCSGGVSGPGFAMGSSIVLPDGTPMLMSFVNGWGSEGPFSIDCTADGVCAVVLANTTLSYFAGRQTFLIPFLSDLVFQPDGYQHLARRPLVIGEDGDSNDIAVVAQGSGDFLVLWRDGDGFRSRRVTITRDMYDSQNFRWSDPVMLPPGTEPPSLLTVGTPSLYYDLASFGDRLFAFLNMGYGAAGQAAQMELSSSGLPALLSFPQRLVEDGPSVSAYIDGDCGTTTCAATWLSTEGIALWRGRP